MKRMPLFLGVLLATLLWPLAASAWPTYDVTVVRVIDGDTAVVDVAIWPGLTERISIRIAGINAPEIHTHNVCEKTAGLQAKAFAEKFLVGKVTLVGIDPGATKFAGRMNGSLWVNGVDMGQAEITAGLARPYFGGKRKPWCAP